ncbi:DUF4231 domain-containing protein [Burkholderia sp. R-70211]|nr:DUF4231 domain-containing protein [Burkholderia sp. R-70211]
MSDYPALYHAADKESLTAQQKFFGTIFANITCLILASIASSLDFHSKWISIAQAIILLAGLASSIYLATGRPDRIWYNGRALAESVKTSTWRYMMKAEPFDANLDVRPLFMTRLKTIFDQNKSVAKSMVDFADGVQITDYMRNTRALPLDQRKALYENERTVEQQKWYARKAQYNKKKANSFFLFLCLLNAAAVISTLLKIAYPDPKFWPTDILVTCSAALLSWIQAKRFQELSSAYSLAAYEIGFIREQLARITTEKKFSLFVSDAENAFSREHTQWVARKDE